MLNVIAGLHRSSENNWDSLKSNSVGREQKAPVGVLQEGHIPRKQFLFRWWQNHVAALQYGSIFKYNLSPLDLTRILCWDQKTSAMHMQSVMLPHIGHDM